MIKKSHLKECLNKAFKKKESNKTIFRYTVKSDIDINNHPFNSKNIFIFLTLKKNILVLINA